MKNLFFTLILIVGYNSYNIRASVAEDVFLSPEVQALILNVPHYQQCNSSWGSNQLGNCSGLTMCSHGCATTCMAMLLKSNGVNVNPGQLNTHLKTNGGYNTNCEIYWNVAASYPGSSMAWVSSASFSLVKCKSEIDEGDPVIANVIVNGVNHFIVIIGYNNNGTLSSDFVVLDPLQTVQKYLNNYSNILGLRTFNNVTTITGSGFGKVSAGVSISPNPVRPAQPFTASFTLTETAGFPIVFEEVTAAILNANDVLIFDMTWRHNVSLSANGTYVYNVTSNQFGPNTTPGTYKVMARGKVSGGSWFNFQVTSNGVNPKIFTVSPMTNLLEISNEIPDRFYLHQNYPNPFNPNTRIIFDLPKENKTQLTIYNVEGKEIMKLIDKNLNPGKYTLTLNGDKLSSGIYFYRIVSGEFMEMRRMILLK